MPSGKRWRLPCSIGGCIVLVWVSLVPVTSLGCLLGRDFLDAVGAVLNFGQRTLDCTFLGTGTQRLQQMAAGHFTLQMIPEQWTRPAPGRWRKCGQDGIVELQLTSKEWLNRVLREGHNIAGADSHDHMLTESSLMAGRAVLELHDAFESTSDNGGPLAQEMRFSRSCSEVRQQRVLAGSFQNEQFSEVNGCRVEQHRAYEIGPGTTSPKDADGRISVGLRTISVEKVCAPNVGSKGLALVRIATLAAAAILFAVLAISLSVDLYTDGMVPSDASHGLGQVPASSSLPHLGEEPGEVFHSWQFGRTWNISQSCGPGRCIHGGQDVDGHVGCEIHEGTVSSLEGISHSRGQEEGRSREERCKPRIGGQIHVGTSGRSSSIEGRFDSFGCSTACGSGCERHGADDSGQDSAYMVQLLMNNSRGPKDSPVKTVPEAKPSSSESPSRVNAQTPQSMKSSWLPAEDLVEGRMVQVESKMTAMMAEQEQRFQSMMHQVMTHVMGMQQHVVPPVVDITEEAEMMG